MFCTCQLQERTFSTMKDATHQKVRLQKKIYYINITNIQNKKSMRNHMRNTGHMSNIRKLYVYDKRRFYIHMQKE